VPYRLLVQQLDSRFASLSPELQRAARWVREHPAELGLQSMRQSARAAGVSPATMTRLAQALDFSGFDAMRRPAMAALARSAGKTQAPGTDTSTEDPGMGPAGVLQPAQAANVASVLSRNPAAQLLAAARSILAARQVLFLGLRASFGIAHHLRYTCDWLRPGTALATDPGGAWADQLAELGTSDLLVAISQAPYTVQTVQAAQQLRARGVRVLALTDNPLSPLAREATNVLLFDTASPSFFHSQVGAQALSEALMATVAEQGGPAVLQRLAERQRRLQAAQVYWDKPARQAASV
jgi:DNA-binding MurR/RpiR family transcriptional regulator